ncbi:hypothetical protein FRX31_026614 [Thalictrum thalictroides]|uniref:Transmembrane protein n=1 Tax=Thalictrum thalictroides TaxID=46969 RepID=A0A7J6VFB9_THATH|nr:hypothetical protein FRX31_026614 [Thalictrum thalictroides]
MCLRQQCSRFFSLVYGYFFSESIANSVVSWLLSCSIPGEQHTANSRLRCLLGSIPARPASAAEFPSCINAGKGSNGKSLFANHGGSSIHVKAEVTVRCGCTDEALSGKLEGDPCLCCYGRKYLRSELGKEATPFSSGLTFFFLLGMITALMWVILFSVVVKIGCYVWKLVVF